MSRISAIVPVFNGERYLASALDSVLSQTRPADEVVAVDDGSTDGTPGVLKSFGDRIRVVRTENRGVGAARNAGLRAAAGDYVGFLDADDRWMPDKLAAFARALEGAPEAVLAFSDAIVVDGAGLPLRVLRRPPPAGPLYQRLVGRNIIVTSTAVVRREAALAAGGFREDFTCKAGVEDWEFFLRLCRKGGHLHVPRPLTEYRLHAESAIQTKRFDLKKDGLRVLELQEGVPEWTPALRALGRAYVHFDSGVRHLAAGDPGAARADLREALGHGRFRRRALVYSAVSFLPAKAVSFLRGLRRKLS